MDKEKNLETQVNDDEDPPTQEDYLDFELEIGTGSGRVYPVAVVRSAAGEAREMMQFPYDDLALENQLLTLQNALLRSGGLRLQQRPGPHNALGLVQFVFPNRRDVSLHATPSVELFSRSRRDFSHGCIRVEDPVGLASWVLRDVPGWTPERVRGAMGGSETQVVTLDRPIPVLIVYATAVVTEDGEVLFLEDVYGHDRALERALASAR